MTELKAARNLTGIEAARGLAATAVVLYHSARHLDKIHGAASLKQIFQFGHAGVDLFFVLSGFIILYVHYKDIGRPARVGHYFWRRLTRIMPIYWAALAVTIVFAISGGHPLPSGAQLLWSVTLLPSRTEMILGIAWTLQFEMFFYAVFSLLIFNRLIGILIFTIWGVSIVWAAVGGGVPALVPPLIYGTPCVEFFFGMGVAFIIKKYSLPVPGLIFVGAAALLLLGCVGDDARIFDGFAPSARLIYGSSAALMILGLVDADRRGRISVPKKLKALGTASYSIYLFQFIFIGVVWKVWLGAGLNSAFPPVVIFPILAAAGVIGGLAASRWIEYPLMGLIRQRRRPTNRLEIGRPIPPWTASSPTGPTASFALRSPTPHDRARAVRQDEIAL